MIEGFRSVPKTPFRVNIAAKRKVYLQFWRLISHLFGFLDLMEERICSAYSLGKCNIDVTSSNHDIPLMMCECDECEFCPRRSRARVNIVRGLIFFHAGTCGFYDRAAGKNRCFECHHRCGGRLNMTDCEREGILGGYRLNPVVEEFMLEMHNGHYGVGALTPEVVAAVQKITQDMVYELKSRYSNGAGPLMATLLQKLGVGADPATTTVSSDIPLKSLPPWAVSLNDAPSVQELAAVADPAASLEPPIIPIPNESLAPWEASPNETPSVNLRDVLQSCIVRGGRGFSEALAGHSALPGCTDAAASGAAAASDAASGAANPSTAPATDAAASRATAASSAASGAASASTAAATDTAASGDAAASDAASGAASALGAASSGATAPGASFTSTAAAATDAATSNLTNSELEAMAAAPDLARIKCIKRKFYMLHTDDSRWYQYSRKEVNELAGNVVVNGKEYEAGPHAWDMKDSTQRGFQLRQGARKKRVVHGLLAQPPSGAPSLGLTPLQTDSLPQCVQDCVRLLRLTSSKPVHLVSDVPNAMDGFLKPSKWGWDGLDISRLTNCIEKLIQLAQPTDLFILQTHHTDTNTSRHCCCIKERMLCCPFDTIWRPLCLEAFEALHIDRIMKIYKK